MRNPDRPLRIYKGKWYTSVIYRDYIHTTLWDGTFTKGYPPTDSAFLESARYLGYGDDIYWHMVEHDLAHNWIPDYLDVGYSVALWNQSHDVDAWLKPCPPEAVEEENKVSYLQAALNGQEYGIGQMKGLFGGQADRMIRLALAIFRPDGKAMTRDWASSVP